MSNAQHIANAIQTELSRENGESAAESLRWAVWLVWEELGGVDSMSAAQFADGAVLLGIKRGTATNRYYEAKRNWEAMNG